MLSVIFCFSSPFCALFLEKTSAKLFAAADKCWPAKSRFWPDETLSPASGSALTMAKSDWL